MRSPISSFLSYIVGVGCAAILFVRPVYAQVDGGPNISAGVLEQVGDEWQAVTLPFTYENMVVVAVPVYTIEQSPAVARIRNANGNSFEVRVQNPSGEELKGYGIHYIVVEAGVYTVEEHGIQMEAVLVGSDVVDSAGGWNGELIAYENDYDAPVILGQVMSFNDERWSVFWARGLLVSLPPGEFAFIGRHVGEDSDLERLQEDIGYIVLETGSGSTVSYVYQAFTGEDIIEGMEGNAPYRYQHELEEGQVAVLSAAAMDGANGGWPVLWSDTGLSDGSVQLAFDEDQLFDEERLHTTEQVAVLVLESTQVIPQVTGFSPAKGEIGTEVTVQGINLSGIQEAYFNGVLSSSLDIVNEQEIRITVPEGADTGPLFLVGEGGLEVVSAELFVVTYAEAAAGINLCRLTEAAVEQSSEDTPQSGPEKACDGVLNGTQASGTITATLSENEAWWEVDLGAVYNISEVRVVNRIDCCLDELANFIIFTSVAPFASKSVQFTLAEPNVRAYIVGEVGEQVTVGVGEPGRFVRLQYPGSGALTFSEVEVVAANGEIVQVGRDVETPHDGALRLESLYPSPARDRVNLKYSTPETSHTEISVYDALGREVLRLVDSVQPAGRYIRSISTAALAPGVYLLNIEASGATASASFVKTAN
ncbi:MAG: T9SS type A sorting domain-containing protein [Rhodothermaceae bacterium]|nr:T9SS type A sorting domain-containing protein [Rhodothermaceae bacterium]